MKYDTYSQYDSAHTGLAERAFLTVWASLSQWHNSLVLVGGMVPKYLEAVLAGWTVIRLTEKQLELDFIERIVELMHHRYKKLSLTPDES